MAPAGNPEFVNVVAVLPEETVVHPPLPVLLLWSWNVTGPGAPFDVYVQAISRLPAAPGVTVRPAGTAGIDGGVVTGAATAQAEKPSALNARIR